MRTITAMLAATAAVALSACDTGDDPGAPAITAKAAKASVERSARLQLALQAIPAEAREQRLVSVYSNAGTAARDRQDVMVVYAAARKDRAAQVERTVKAL